MQNEHEIFADDSNGEQILDDSMFDDFEQDDMYDNDIAFLPSEDYNSFCENY